ncbi:MAG: hypothetical protein ACM3QS_14925 [Bacteroidota bacterium]
MSGRIVLLLSCLLLAAALAGCASVAGAGPSGPGPIRVEQVPPVTGTVHVATLEATPVEPMRVLWKVSSYVIGKNAAWGEKEAQAMLFKGLDINESEILFNGQACKGVTFQVEEVNPADYLPGAWGTSPAELGIPDAGARLYKTNCDLPGFGEYLRLSDRRLVVPMHGVYFFFQPTAIQ